MTWVIEGENGQTRTFETRSEAEDELKDLGTLNMELSLYHDAATDGGEVVEEPPAEDIAMVESSDDEQLLGVDVCVHCGNDIDDGHCPDCDSRTIENNAQLPDDISLSSEAVEAIETVKDSGLDTDPLSVLPGFMVDSIKGTQAVNKRGYAMIAERYGIEVSTKMIESPWDNDEGRVVCKATATTDSGKTYNAYGTACESDGDDSANLIELADTRSQKRAVQWASGFGIVGYQELTGQLEGEQ